MSQNNKEICRVGDTYFTVNSGGLDAQAIDKVIEHYKKLFQSDQNFTPEDLKWREGDTFTLRLDKKHKKLNKISE